MSVIEQRLDNGVLHITLNRPEKRNALNEEMFDTLVGVAETAQKNADLKAIVISGAGKSFCAGLDFSTHRAVAKEGANGQRPYADPNDPDSTGLRQPGRGQRIVKALRDSPVPVIAVIHGHAIGGGLQIALGADIRIVTADAVLAFAEIEFGLTVDMGGSQLLPRLIGSDRALKLLTTARRISGALAYEWGLVTAVSDDPHTAASKLAGSIASRGRPAIVETKRLVRLADTGTVEAGMREELSVMAKNVGSPEQIQAVEQYFAKRGR